MFDPTLLALILTSIFIGFLLGRWQPFSKKKTTFQDENNLNNEYFTGLNYLLNEQTDEAIDSFIKALELSTDDNVKTYIIIGRLFRRRGEIEKAIQAHQDILARSSLTKEQSFQVQLELAHDYLKAGLLDRAEALLLELSQVEWSQKDEAVKSLLSVYEQEKEWQKAIDLIMELPHINVTMAIQTGHYYAELANICLQQKEFLQARQNIKKSMAFDKRGVRSNLQLGLLEYKLGNYREATRVLQKIARKNPLFISESIELLEKCYEHIHTQHGLSTYLAYCLKNYPGIAVIAATTRKIAASQSDHEASQFAAERIIQHPSLKGMDFLIENQLHNIKGNGQQLVLLLRDIVKKILAAQPIYRCMNCGFEGKELHWRCPRCHVWGKIEPITGLEGQ
ncbi:MAG: lipopolysaccharide assembly protein LapB [Endozoicomonadaceae bacterium]|nr:lipopolysaccharide assembly protein LapB [Endozoicomonadaceae bacterium]